MIVATVDWGYAVPATIGALALAYTSVTSTRRGKQNQQHLADIVPKVTAIDTAVNGQPSDALPMVDKVTNIGQEQDRVKEELATVSDPWEMVGQKLDLILVAIQASSEERRENQ